MLFTKKRFIICPIKKGICMKKISIIIPVHNTELYLESCLKSVLNQTEKSIEVIAINDHSTDNSLAILKKYEKCYPYKMKVIDLKDKFGVSCARNEGLKVAQGKYIGFVDSDDFVSINMYNDFCESLEYYNMQIAIGNFYRVASNRVLNEFYISPEENPKFCNYLKYPRNIQVESPAVWDKVFSHDLIENYYFLENHIYEDVGFTYPLLLKAKEALAFYRKDYAYRHTPGSIMNQVGNIKPNILDILYVCYNSQKVSEKWNLTQNQLEELNKTFIDAILRRADDISRWNIKEKEKREYLSQMLSISNYYFPDIKNSKKCEDLIITELSLKQLPFYEESFKRSIKKAAKKTSF